MKSVKSWLNNLLSTDSRKAQRQHVPGLVAYYWHGGNPIAHEIQNVSSTGFYLLTKEQWLPGTLVTMTLQRGDGTDIDVSSERHIAVQSLVVRRGEDGVGLVFIPFETKGSDQEAVLKSTPVGKKALRKFLERLMSDQGYVMIGYMNRDSGTNVAE